METADDDGAAELTVDIDVDDFEPSPRDYSMSVSFQTDRRSKFEGIFNGDVVVACFGGEIEPARGDGNVLMVGRVDENVFGLVLDTEKRMVVTGHVLQCNPVQARLSGLWNERAIGRMESLSKNHRGRVWNGYDDPKTGNSVPWSPKDDHARREYR